MMTSFPHRPSAALSCFGDRHDAFTRLVQNIDGFVYRRRCDAAWTMEFASEGARAVTGYDPHRFLLENRSISFFEMIDEADRRRVTDRIAVAVARQLPFAVRYRINTAFGARVEVEDRGMGVVSDDSKVQAIEGVITVVREKPKPIRQQASLEGSFAAAFLNHSAALVLSRNNGQVCAINRALAQRYELSAEEIIGSGARLDLLCRTLAAKERARFPRASGRTEMDARKASEPSESNVMEVLGAISVPFPSVFGDDMILTIFPDLMRIRNAEQQKQAAERQFVRAQKMECMSHLAAGVFHDFNNVVHALLLNLDLACAESSDRQLNSVLKELRDEAQRTSLLTKRLLTFCANDQSDFERFDLNRIVIGRGKFLRRLIGDAYPLQIFSAPEPLWIEGDPTRIEQIIMNLVINARDAMPRGGPISVQCHAVGAHVACNGRGEPAPKHVRLMVSDAGCGMDSETAQKIFEPFFTTKGSAGTGLGLSTVRMIVEQHHGWTAVDSTLGRGTTISIHLPLCNVAAVPELSEAGENSVWNTDSRPMRVHGSTHPWNRFRSE